MIAVITDPGVGGTFLTWSIYFLSGRHDYFSVRANSVINLTKNPLTEKNAHNFVANQPLDINEFKKFMPELIHSDECMYMHHFRSDTEFAVNELCNNTSKKIVVSTTPELSLYHCGQDRAGIALAWASNKFLSDPDEIYKDQVNYFFNESGRIWNNLGLTDVWDKREFIALNYNPYSVDSIMNYIHPEIHYHHIHALDLWVNFDQSVQHLFDYLNLKINDSRYREWILIYSQWKRKHNNQLNFVWYFKTIVNNILNGNDMDLLRFNLNIYQEAAIQQELIYNHNLNIKTWELTKFVNTKQLHDLLEPNIHDLSKSHIGRLTT